MSAKGKETKGEVALVNSASAVPAYLANVSGSGLTHVDTEDLIIPRIKILQGTSKEPETFDEAKRGEWWVNILDMPLGAEFKFIVCSYRKKVLLMRPMDDKTGEAILARANDGITWDRTGKFQVKIKNVKTPVTWEISDLNVRKSGLLQFGTSLPDDEDSPPAATVFHEFLMYLPEHPEISPLVLSCARTAAKPAKQLVSKIEFKNKPSTSQVYKAKLVSDGDGDQKYYIPEFQSAGWATGEIFATCNSIAERFKNYQGADEEGAAREGGAAPKERGEI